METGNMPEESPMKTVPIILPNGVHMTCPGNHGVLNLAASNIVFGKYKDAQGQERRGWTSVLSMMIGEDRGTIKAFKVHAGKSVRFGAFDVVVKRIDSSRFGLVVMAGQSSHHDVIYGLEKSYLAYNNKSGCIGEKGNRNEIILE